MSRAPRRRMAFVAASLLVAIAAAAGGERRPGREIIMPTDEVKDTFLGYLVGLIENDIPASVDLEYLLGILHELRDAPDLRRISEISWSRGDEPGSRLLAITFDGHLHYDVPLMIFGDHPGSIDASSTIVIREQRWASGIDWPDGTFRRFTVELGYASVDFAEWLDVLGGQLLDDFTLTAVALFEFRGRWHAMLVGRGARGQTVPWVFNLSRNRILFPLPEKLVDLADRLLRGR